jgi:hypothetical protein
VVPMSTTAPPEVPDRATVDDTLKVIHDHADRIFLWDYDRSRGQLVTLYNKAMGSQWNSVTDLDWDTPVDPEQLVGTAADPNPIVEIARRAVAVPGSPIASWGEKELTQLGIEVLKAQLSQFMHGEQGAMMVAAKIVETVPWIDAKYYAATQTMDEARHTEVFAKYLHTKLGEAYPMSPFLVIESLALAAFGGMLRAAREPLLKKLLRYVMSDEARHVAFGVLSLSEYYSDMSEAELKDRQDFLLEATIHNRARSTTPEIWNRMGVDVKTMVPALKEAAASMGGSVYSGFEHSFYAKLVPNVRKLGLLDANDGHLRKRWGEAGLMRFEMADDTASDYESYDEVAKDRAEADTEAATA